MKNYQRINLGKWGEEVAKNYLMKKGYVFFKQNVRIGRGEIDLVFGKGSLLVIAEVKTKSSRNYGDPGEMVDMKKIRQIEYLVEEMLKRKKKESMNWRLDVVGVIGDGKVVEEIMHYENVSYW